MNNRLAPADLIAAWVGLMTRHAVAVVVVGLIVTALAGGYVATHLQIDSDTADLISPKLAWRQDYLAYQKAFPVYTDNLVVVVHGVTPALADRATRRLAAAMRDQPQLFRDVYAPRANRFFARNGLLYLDQSALHKLSRRLTRIQPFLGRLAAQPTLVTFFSLLDKAMAPDAAVDFDLAPIFGQLDAAFAASRRQRFYQVSWQMLMGGAKRPGASKQRVILTKPRLDYNRVLAGAKPMARVDTLAGKLGLDAAHGVTVRQTGDVALSDQQLGSVFHGAVWGALGALLVVGVIVYIGLRSLRLMAAALVSLIAGLIGTATFAIWAVGTLNLISIAFAVLYIGLGIDYAIHLCLGYREALAARADSRAAIKQAARNRGVSLALCAVTTAAGFFAFIPTPYAGVAELGLISGTGMFVSLVVSLTFLPAAISLLPASRIPALARGRGIAGSRAPYIGKRARAVICIAAALVAVACATALPYVRFDSNALDMQNQNSEAVRTFRQLLANSAHSPLTLVTTRPTLDAAARLADRLTARPEVAEARTLADFVPDKQKSKLAIIDDMALTLALRSPDMSQRAPPAAARRAIAKFADTLAAWRGRAPAGPARAAATELAKSLADWRDWFASQPGSRRQAILAKLRQTVLAGLAPQIDNLRAGLHASHVALADLPRAIHKRWVGTNGSYRVQAYAAGKLDDPAALAAFVAGARRVAPHITGEPVLQIEAGRTVSHAFVRAFAYAAVFISLLLLVLMRSIANTLRVLAPLVLGGLGVCAATVWLNIPFNFTNIIALPLLFGVGVDSGIHVVHRLRGASSRVAFLATGTARAIILSSLTTLAGFGALAFSRHAGTASMGRLLAIGMIAILIFTLILVPSLFGDRNKGKDPG